MFTNFAFSGTCEKLSSRVFCLSYLILLSLQWNWFSLESILVRSSFSVMLSVRHNAATTKTLVLVFTVKLVSYIFVGEINDFLFFSHWWSFNRAALIVLLLLDFLLGVINMDNDSIDVSSKENGMKRWENYQNHVYVLQHSPHVIDCCVHCHHFNIIIIMDFTFIIILVSLLLSFNFIIINSWCHCLCAVCSSWWPTL